MSRARSAKKATAKRPVHEARAHAETTPVKLWGGRFTGSLDPVFEAFQESLSIDARLWRDDIAGSIAWAGALRGAGVLDKRETTELVTALESLALELEERPELLVSTTAEDIHSLVEQELTRRVGDLAKKLHTGRSRNDQVATDLRLHTRALADRLDEALQRLMSALVGIADQHAATALPGYTHLQRGQPVTVGHHALAYVEMFARDRQRLEDAAARADACPLGSGALAGTAWGVDRDALAHLLEFQRGPTQNSLDAVSDRDFMVELVFVCTLVMTHLSRLCEDWIIYSSFEAGFLQLSDAVTTGSSLMPQKKNPDVLELVRGRTGQVHGHLQALLVLLKGLPLAYNRDMQEDKRSFFAAVDTTAAALSVMTIAAEGASFDAERCAAEAARGYLNATDLADLLVQAGVPFRVAHERVGQAVRRALELGVELEHLPASEKKRLMPELPDDLTQLLSVDAVLARRSVVGGTAPARVREQVKRWRKLLR